MLITRKVLHFLVFACGVLLFSGIPSTAAAQAGSNNSNPCETGSFWPPEADHSTTQGLTPVGEGTIVYDSNQGICWLADANLAGNPEVRATVSLSELNPDGSAPVINPDGTMDWETALNWVNALNNYDHGRGWENHNNWQLPTNPALDLTCSAVNVDNFGAQCKGSALGNLYNVGLAQSFPDSVVPRLLNIVWPFINLQPGLYWAADPNAGGQATFSFNTGISGGNTTKYNFFHILPMTKTVLGSLPIGNGVLPYWSGPAVGRAVYDTVTGISWVVNANLPAFDNFGVTSTTNITADLPGTNGGTVNVPLVENDGTVYLSVNSARKCPGSATSGLTTEWIFAMNSSEYAGTNDWDLPCLTDLENLYNDMSITAGDTRLEWPFAVGPFWRLQPGFYWACPLAAGAGSNGPCDLSSPPPGGLQWSFNFDDGFEGTDLPSKQFYVMVYFPAP